MRWLIAEAPDLPPGFRVVRVDGRESPAYVLNLLDPPASLLRFCRREGGSNRSQAVGVLGALAPWLSGGSRRAEKSEAAERS